MKKLNHTNLIILTLLVCLSFGCIFGSKEKTPIISPPTATPIPTSTPITSIQKNISLSIAKSEDSITKTNLALIKITIGEIPFLRMSFC